MHFGIRKWGHSFKTTASHQKGVFKSWWQCKLVQGIIAIWRWEKISLEEVQLYWKVSESFVPWTSNL